ncbi:hypothetical protein NS201_22295, partial [Pseudomonas oryzihabitans]
VIVKRLTPSTPVQFILAGVLSLGREKRPHPSPLPGGEGTRSGATGRLERFLLVEACKERKS